MKKFNISERMACRLAGLSRTAWRRPLKAETVADLDAGIREWLRDFADDHPRWGYRRAYHKAREVGWQVNHKKVQKLWKEEGLRVRVKRKRKRTGESTVPPVTKATKPDEVWAIDFQFDVCERGKAIKICSIVDEYTRESLGGLVERKITARDLCNHLDEIISRRGSTPVILRLDNGPELISEALAAWAGTKTGLVFIPPGQPWLNGYIESFNGKLRDECLQINSFYSLLHARVVIEDWKTEYNEIRPHSALGYKTPNQYAASCQGRQLEPIRLT